MKKYLSKLIAGGGKKQPGNSDFRKVYKDIDLEERINSHEDELEVIHDGFQNQVRRYLVNGNITNEYSIINQRGIRGVALCRPGSYSIAVLKSYLFQLKMKHTSIGYVQKLSVHSMKNGNEIYSYYLKPSMKLQTTHPAEQLYGNITLELLLENSIPKKLKCMSTYYSDANYKDVRDIDEWLNVIFLGEDFNL